MELITLDTFPLLVVLALPGLIAIKVFDLLVPSERRDWSNHILEVLAYGTINFGIWFWLIDYLLAQRAEMPWRFRMGMVLILLLSPAMLGVVANLVLKCEKLRRWIRHPTPTAWDHFFQHGRECWILCSLKNGQRIGGLYREGSFAGSFPHTRDVYIREVWKLTDNGTFVRPVERTMGALVSMEDCSFLEFIEVGKE